MNKDKLAKIFSEAMISAAHSLAMNYGTSESYQAYLTSEDLKDIFPVLKTINVQLCDNETETWILSVSDKEIVSVDDIDDMHPHVAKLVKEII